MRACAFCADVGGLERPIMRYAAFPILFDSVFLLPFFLGVLEFLSVCVRGRFAGQYGEYPRFKVSELGRKTVVAMGNRSERRQNPTSGLRLYPNTWKSLPFPSLLAIPLSGTKV